MADALELTVLTPEKQFFKSQVTLIKTANLMGDLEIMAHHMPLITLLKPTVTEFVDMEGKRYKAFTSGGTLEVKNNKAIILCDACEWPEDIDEERAKAAKERAEKRLKENGEDIDALRAKLALVRALTRLKIRS